MIQVSKKMLGLMTAAVAVFTVSAAAVAWSPERPTHTVEKPADYVTFNSITNNPREGDERAFFELKDAANTQPNGFAHKIDVKDGQEVTLRIYAHNNAASSLNGENFDGKGVAKNTKVRVWLPSVTDNVMRANAYISADNALPKEVADTADFYDADGQKFSISYVPGSAVAYNNAVGQAGMKLSDSIVTTGAPIGYQSANGVVPGCFQYANVISLKVKVKMNSPNFEVAKTVSKVTSDNKYSFSENVNVKQGETVAFQLKFKNTGNTQIADAVLRDQLPAGMTMVPGSTQVIYGTDPTPKPVGNDGIVSNGGIKIGTYNPGGASYTLFKATVNKDDKICNTKLTNIAEARAAGGVGSDTATVTVECADKPKTPVYSCDALALTMLGGRKISANVKVTATNGAVYKTTAFDFGDNTKLVTDKTTVEHTYAADGTYIVRAVPSFMVDGKLVTAESQACVKTVTFKAGEVVTPPTETPTVLPNTGAGSVIGLFAGATIAGAFGHRLWMIRRNNG